MSYGWLVSERPDPRFRWSLHVIIYALLAPMLAHSVHSADVLHRNFRLYNSELWVLFVSDSTFNDWRIGIVLGALVEAALTFLVLWPFVKSPIKRWGAWVCCAALWTYLAFIGEVAIK